MPLDRASVDAAIDMLRARTGGKRRDLPAALLRQSGARTRGGRCGARGAAGCRDFGQPRDPAGDQGISAHQHDGDQCLCAAGGARLCHRACRAAARSRHRCATATHAVEWRPWRPPNSPPLAPAHIIESGPAAGVVGGAALAIKLEEPRIITFDMGGTTAKAGLVENGEVMRSEASGGRRRRDGGIAPAGRRGLSAEAAGDRPGRGGCRRRIDLPAGCGGGAEGRAGQRRRRSWTGLLRPRRHRADHHRLQSGARLSRSGGPGRRSAEAGRGCRACGDCARVWRSRCAARWRKRRSACCGWHRRR